MGSSGTLILFFGEVKDIFKPTYSITVSFPNASGLLKGSDVYLSGAPIGKVTDRSASRFPDTQLVEVGLKIDKKHRQDPQADADATSSAAPVCSATVTSTSSQSNIPRKKSLRKTRNPVYVKRRRDHCCGTKSRGTSTELDEQRRAAH